MRVPLVMVISLYTVSVFGLAIVLVFIGAKMLLIDVYKIPVLASLGVVAAILAAVVVAAFSIGTGPTALICVAILLAGTRIVMLTAKGRDTDVARGMGAGADAYVIKPFSTQELVQRVRELLA